MFALTPRTVGWLLLSGSFWGCERRATPEECRDLLGHYVTMLVREQNPDLSDHDLEAQVDKTRERAAAEPSFRDCPRQIDLSELRCAMAAPNVDTLERCIE